MRNANLRRFCLALLALIWMAAGACAEYYRVLRPGESGTDVKNMQQALAFLQYAVRLDGQYDAQTEQAVRAFQLAQKLTADGKAGSVTLTRLYDLAPQFRPGAAKATATQAPVAAPSFTDGIYKLGDEASGVRTLQQRLIDLGYPIARADAVYGVKTREAVAMFQAANGLKQDGKAGPGTMSVLFSAAAKRAPAQTAAPTQTPRPTQAPAATEPPLSTAAPAQPVLTVPRGTYRLGDEASGVRLIQQRLIDLGYPVARADAVYGPQTRDAVKQFQGANGLYPDGRAGAATLSALFSQSAKRAGSAPTATAQPTAAPSDPAATQPVATAVEATEGRGTLNFRAQPSTAGIYFIEAIPHGETLLVYSIGDTWCRVQYKGRQGYVMTRFLSIAKSGQDAAPTASPAVTPTAAPDGKPAGYVTLKIDSRDGEGNLVTLLQQRLKALGYPLAVDGVFGTGTHDAVVAFQQNNGMKTTGIADAAMQKLLYEGSPKGYTAGASAGNGPQSSAPGNVQLLHWFKQVKPSLSAGQRLVVYHPASGTSFTLRAYSLGRHLDAEPLTLSDTQRMNSAFGPASWNVNAVYVKLPNGVWTLATMHNRPHLSGSISDNGFDGHLCVHFLRDMEEAQKNDPNYGVTNQKVIRSTWKKMTGETLDY